jgi:hypothetical protein
MSGATAQQLKLRLFVEGVEIPIIAASVQTAPNSPAMCAIQIPPLAEATRFFPRSLVHVYFLDLYESQSPFVSKRGPSAPTQSHSPTTYEQGLVNSRDFRSAEEAIDIGERDIRNQRYKLLFGGEFIGFQWTKSSANRSIVLQCADFSNYWDYAYQWNNTDLFGPGIKALFSGGSTDLFTDFLTDEGSQIIQIINTPSAQFPKLKGLLGGLIHLLESIGGSYYYGKQYAGQNTFFSLAELRLHITQMITAYENDPTAANLLGAGYDALFGRTLGGLGSQVSFRQAINALMSAIFHETYAIPTPMYVPGTEGTVSGAVRRSMKNHPKYKGLVEQTQNMVEGLRALITAMASDDAASNASITREEVKKTLQNMVRALKESMTVTRAVTEIQGARGFLGSASTVLGQALAKTNKYTPGNAASAQSIITQLNSAIDQLKRVTEFELTAKTASKGVPARLNQQIFRPDVWFSAPPRCNVLFPEHWTSMDYQRMFLQEPTRFLLKTNDEFFGEDELFDQFFFAPRARTVKAQQRNLQGMLANDLLDHELFTGILPVFEKMGELNIFAARTGKIDGKQPKIGLAQRSTNFLYFKHRFAARGMSISARFNPYIAPGFPGLIIDKHVDMQTLMHHQELVQKYASQNGTSTNQDIQKLLGTHFLGNFTQVVHTVDQRNGRTDIQCGFPRQYEESVEFLGATAEDQKVMKRFGDNALRSTDVAAFNPPRVSSLGPNYGIIRRVTEVTDKYVADPLDRTPLLPLFLGGRREGTGELKIKVPAGLQLEASEYGEDVATLVGNRTQLVTFRAFTIEEEIPRYRQEVVDLPAEEYIRPGWYGDCWHSAKIGAVYEKFFGTGAITDPQQAADPAGASTGTQDRDAADALAEATIDMTDEARQTAPAILTLDKNSSIQQAVGFLVQLYSYVKHGGLDVEEFIRSYVWRPVATMVDIFGSSDLQLDNDGHTVVQGIEGFHSRAFGPYEDLFGLVPPDIENIVGIKRNKSMQGTRQEGQPQTAARTDVRKRRQDAVKEYVSALQFARAILG